MISSSLSVNTFDGFLGIFSLPPSLKTYLYVRE
jgi:hypothetical protein